ncbi:hypothetical protein ACOSQ3_028266 [Xanthoceras sorbifolium]
MVMRYQRKNGSLYNSPSTTAAALSHHDFQNAACLHYIRTILDKFDDSVYPFHTYIGLTMVDIVESLGIDRHFKKEITGVLDETYSSLNFGNEDFQKLAVDDFNICQSIYHEELKHLDRWVVDKIGQAKICLTEDGLLLLLCGSYPHLS